MWSSSFCLAGLKQMGYLESTSFALVEKGQKGNENPLTVQHWMSLISQFTLCFAASASTILLCIFKSNCHLPHQHSADSGLQSGAGKKKVPCKNRHTGTYYAALVVRDNLWRLDVFTVHEDEVWALGARALISNKWFCFTEVNVLQAVWLVIAVKIICRVRGVRRASSGISSKNQGIWHATVSHARHNVFEMCVKYCLINKSLHDETVMLQRGTLSSMLSWAKCAILWLIAFCYSLHLCIK